MVPIMSIDDIENCATTRAFRKKALLEPGSYFPFKVLIGAADERKKAGYVPANTPTINPTAKRTSSRTGLAINPNVRVFSEKLLKRGSRSSIIKIEIKTAIKLIRIDSPMNCFINCVLSAPKTFLMPTSLALFADLAVARFIKLMQAINSIKTPTTPKI